MDADDGRFQVLARRHAVIPTTVLRDAPSARAIQVWALLSLHADFTDTRSWPSVRRLAGMARCSTERVRDALIGLAEAGLLHVEPGDRTTPNTYDLRPAWDGGEPPAGVGGGPPRVGGGPPITDKGNLSPAERVKVSEVIEAWRAALAPRAKPSRARAAKVAARLREGYTVAELTKAITGCSKSAWHIEGHHTDLSLICRDAAHVDRFIALADDLGTTPAKGRPPAAAAPAQLSTDEVVLNDLMAAIAAEADPAERARLQADAEAVRLRIASPAPKITTQPEPRR